MNSTFTKKLIQMDSLPLVLRALRERRDAILQGIEEGQISADSDAIKELAELNIAIGDVPEVGNG